MKFQPKTLIVAIALALGGYAPLPLAATSKTKANTQPFVVSGQNSVVESGLGRRIATDGSGRFLTVWTADNTIYARYTRNGVPEGNPFSVGQAVNDLLPLSAAMNTQGEAVVCWPDSGITCQRIPANTATDLVSPVLLDASGVPAVALDDNGSFIVAWNNDASSGTYDYSGYTYDYSSDYSNTGSYDSSANVIQAQRFNSADEAQMALDIAANANNSTPDIAVSANGQAVVVWSGDSGVYARQIEADDSLGTQIQVDSTPASDHSFEQDDRSTIYRLATPTVAMNDGGDFAIAWMRSKVVSSRKFVKGKCHTVKYYGQTYRYCDDDSYSYSDVKSSGIFAQRFSRNDQKQSNGDMVVQFKEKQLHFLPQIAFDSSGNFLIAWQDAQVVQQCYSYYGTQYCQSTPKSASVYARKYEKAKNKLAAVSSVAKANANAEFNILPSVALDNNGNYQLVWTAIDTVKTTYAGYSYDETQSSLFTARFYPGKTNP